MHNNIIIMLKIFLKHLKNNNVLLYTAIGMLFLQGSNFVSGVLLARYLPTSDFGKFQLLVSLVTSTAIVAKIGLDEGYVYYLPKIRKTGVNEKIFSIYTLLVTLIISAIIGLLIYLFSEPLNKIVLRNIEFSYELNIFGIYLCSFVLFTMSASILRGLEFFNFRAFIVYYFNPIFFLAIIAILIVLNGSLKVIQVYSFKIVVLFVVGLIGYGYIFHKLSAKSKVYSLNFSILKKYHLFSISLIFLTLIEFLAEQPTIDLLILANLKSAESVGIYAANYKIAFLLFIPYLAFQVIYVSKFSNLYTNGEFEELKQLYKSTRKKMFYISLVLVIFLILVYDFLIQLFGAQYKEGKVIFIILSIGFSFFSMNGLNNLMFIVSNKKRILALLDFLFILLLILLGYLLVSLLGIEGMAYSDTILFILFTCIKRFAIKKANVLKVEVN